MAIEDDTDREQLLADDGVTLSKAGQSDITVLFNDTYISALEMQSSDPNALARSSDITAASIELGNTITINSANYTVRELQPDGQGMTRLILEAQ